MRELATLLPDLAPPAGGLARLQQSVAATRRPMHVRPRWALAGAACVAAAIVAAMLPSWIARQQRTDALVQALRGSTAPVPGIEVAHGAALELPSGQANVKLFLVQTLPPPSLAKGD
jgi:hypothetical protein